MDTDTVLDVNQGVWNFFLKRHPFVFFFLVILPVFITIGIGYLEFVLGGTALFQSQASEEGAFIITLLPLVVSFVTFAVVKSGMERLFYTELATALGCTYQEISTPITSGQFANMTAVHGRFSNVLSGTYSALPFKLGDFTYYTQEGKESKAHPYTLGVVTMNAALPHVICIPKIWTSVVFDKWKPSDTKELSLEGNFNSVFTVFVPEGSEIEALQVLEPNVMEKLMGDFEDFGFECLDSSVYLFTPGSMKENREAVLRLYALLQRFCDVLTPELRSFAATN